MDSEEEEKEEMVEEEEGDEEVKIVEEVKGRGEKEEMEEVAKTRCRTGTPRMGGTDLRIKEVKAMVKSKNT